MTGGTNDILVKIPDDQLPRLANLYEKHASWAPHMVSFIHMGIKWKKSPKFRESISFLSPNSSWEEDGTIVAIIQFHRYDIIVFTLDEQCANLYEGLMKTSLIDYSRRVLFYGVHEKHVPTVMKYLEAKKIDMTKNNPCLIYGVSPKNARNFILECPPDVCIKKLEPSEAQEVNSFWPHRFLGSEEYIANFIEANGGYGIFLKSTNELVAWVLKHAFGHLGVLQTKEEHLKKGYGSLIAKVLSKEIAEEGHWPLGTILLNNTVSIKMFEKMGFQKIGVCSFIIIDEANTSV